MVAEGSERLFLPAEKLMTPTPNPTKNKPAMSIRFGCTFPIADVHEKRVAELKKEVDNLSKDAWMYPDPKSLVGLK